MKKIIISSVLGVVLGTISTFGQGYFYFGGFPHTVWNDTPPGEPVCDGTFDAVFLWGNVGTTPLIASIMNGVPTNNATSFSYATAWNAILNDPHYAIGVDNATSTAAIASGLPNGPYGGFDYEGGTEFAVPGTTPGAAYSLYVVAWETDGGVYTTPAEAAAAGAAVGWSSTFNYSSALQPPYPAPYAMLVPKFGIGFAGPLDPVPEPAMLALAGLGGLSMIFFRRKKA